MSGIGGFDLCDIDRQSMGKRRAITAIEPIKRDAVFVTDSLGRFDCQLPSSGFILAISVRFQIGACREFSLIDSESVASVAQSRCYMLGCPNVRTPFLKAASLYEPAHAV
jgi:hypothetical protein